jgi:hypothetical protein
VIMTPEAPQKYQEIPVQFPADGTPMALRHGNKIWMVDPQDHAAHWFTRNPWWENQRRAALGHRRSCQCRALAGSGQTPHRRPGAAHFHHPPGATRHRLAAGISQLT